MSAAFDTIDHSTLLERLYGHFGISGTVSQWFNSYFSIRFKQTATSSYRWFTFVPAISSFWRSTGGCPYPCSVLFIHDVNKSNNYILMTHYLEPSQSDTHTSIPSLSDCLTDISLWMKSSKLKLNSDKTESISIGTKKQRHKLSNHFPVKLLGNDITPSDSVRNLGVIFDTDFSFHKHVCNICKTCCYHIRDLRRIRRHILLRQYQML